MKITKMTTRIKITDINNIETSEIYPYIDWDRADLQPSNYGTNPTEVVMTTTLPVYFEDIEEDGEVVVAFLVKKGEEYDNPAIYTEGRIAYINII